MKISYYNIHDNNAEQAVQFFQNEISFSIENSSSNNFILIKEDYYYRNSGYQINMLIINIVENLIQIDIISCGGESTISLWQNSEISFINLAEAKIIEYCSSKNIKFDKVLS